VQSRRSENNFLRQDRDHYRKEWSLVQQRVNQVQERNRTRCSAAGTGSLTGDRLMSRACGWNFHRLLLRVVQFRFV
jgi:hypothetical protein